jgi:hypothetical protein
MAKKMKMGDCCSPEMWRAPKAKRKISFGAGLTVIGALWWANSTGMITLEPFWPIIVTAVGIVMVGLGLYLKMM